MSKNGLMAKLEQLACDAERDFPAASVVLWTLYGSLEHYGPDALASVCRNFAIEALGRISQTERKGGAK